MNASAFRGSSLGTGCCSPGPEIMAPEGPHVWLNRAVYVGTPNGLRPGRAAVLVRVFKPI